MNNLLLRAKEQGKSIEIIYMDDNGRISQRTIRIIEICEDKITAFCYLRKSKRLFKKENLLSAFLVKQKYIDKGA